MTFDEAFAAIKQGTVRAGRYASPGTVIRARLPASSHGTCPCPSVPYLFADDASQAPWTPTQQDLFATDWFLL